MTLTNSTTEKAQFQITSANGRETNVDLNASASQNVDLSMYQSPFSVQATVGASTTDMIYDVDEIQSVSVYRSGESYQLRVKSTA